MGWSPCWSSATASTFMSRMSWINRCRVDDVEGAPPDLTLIVTTPTRIFPPLRDGFDAATLLARRDVVLPPLVPMPMYLPFSSFQRPQAKGFVGSKVAHVPPEFDFVVADVGDVDIAAAIA